MRRSCRCTSPARVTMGTWPAVLLGQVPILIYAAAARSPALARYIHTYAEMSGITRESSRTC